jgi:acetoacetyl-CoA synthetase
MLLQSAKEHVLHGNMSSTDVFFYYTTPGWMMYNYLVSGLQTGATVVLFDGSPLFKPAVLWTMAEDLGVTVFGTVSRALSSPDHSLTANCSLRNTSTSSLKTTTRSSITT